jgi:ATP-dependent DNA ligase
MSIYKILTEISELSGRNDKIKLLESYKDNHTLKRVVFLAVNSMVNFYIRKIPSYKPAPATLAGSLDAALDGLAMLSSRTVTGNAAIEFLAKLLSDLDTEDAQVIERIIQKDLKCGVSDSTANKVWPGLIAEYPCMLASAYDQKLVDKVKFPAYVQLKLDGMRFNAIVRNGAVEFRSRNGKEIQIADPLFELPFIYMAAGQNVVFDGELLIKENGRILDRKTGNGILNKAVKGTQSESEGELVCATLWDMIPLSDFEAGVCRRSYEERLRLLSSAITHASNHRVDLVEMKTVNSIDEAQTLFEQYLAQGQEGIILKTRDMIWENKRSKHQIKFKGELECDLKIVDWVEGTGKNVGRMGALVLESADGLVRVGLGTGFSDEDRDNIKPDVIGQIVAIKYNARITDKKSDVDSLFLPVFLEFRLDKTEADSSKDIK